MSNIAALPLTNRALNTNSKLTMYSPMSVLVGYSNPYISPKAPKNSVSRYKAGQWTKDSVKQMSTVTLQDYRELSQEFDTLYSTKSMMSLDGLLSPVSFYPTINGSTAPYKKYNKKYCPVCAGTKKYKLKDTEYYCDYCVEDTVFEISTTSSSSTPTPPYIIASGDDSSIIKNLPLIQNLINNRTIGRIDYKSLNPIIMPVGEMRNSFAQAGDYNAHHIDIVARGMVPMLGSISQSDNISIDQSGLEFFDLNNEDANFDHNSMAFDSEAQLQQIITTTNFRFLGLRGPLVMAGWGYDIDGYPIPNASGDPKEINESGLPKRIRNLEDTVGSFDPSYSGVILGKNQVIVSGKWTPPSKESNFLMGWGLRPDLWPVGPVDLRWDPGRKVWVTPPTESFVDIQIEDDLVPPYPARGFLNDVDRISPLPSGLRRMVFVKDPANQFGAPRGSKLLCKYNYGNGFYEPVNKANIVVTGLIINSDTAKISFVFERGKKDHTQQNVTPDPIQVKYQNPLGFDVGYNDPGIFMYFYSGWILMSANSKC